VTYKKGWLRCKHGVLLKRGKKTVGLCVKCEQFSVRLYDASGKVTDIPVSLAGIYDQGVT
jgi:hypothetical protein